MEMLFILDCMYHLIKSVINFLPEVPEYHYHAYLSKSNMLELNI